jgi:protein-L-isoaspartate(D-aspartate) O-methyltransferase
VPYNEVNLAASIGEASQFVGELRMTAILHVSRPLGRVFVASLLGLLCLAGAASAQTRAQFEAARKKMVEEVIIGSGITDKRVVRAMGEIPRHEFVAQQHRKNAYFDMALPIGDQQTISSPFIVAFMTQSLDPQPTDKVLEIGTGSGYQAAVLSPLVKEVYSIEIVEPLGQRAARTLKRLGYDNVHTKIGDGYLGWPEHAPFDKIIVTCSPEKVPQPLADQLKEGGLMVVPVGERYQQTLYLFRKKDGKLESEALLPTLFVPMTGKAEDAREVKPDPANPQVANGSFEEKAFPNGAQPGWYYERQLKWEEDSAAPDGKHYITFQNSEPGLSAHLLQGFAIDGRHVSEVELSAEIKTTDVVGGPNRDERPYLAMTLYDDQRRELGHLMIGPFLGTSDWHREAKRFKIPPTAREGILRVGLFGATGTLSVDDVRLQKIDAR